MADEDQQNEPIADLRKAADEGRKARTELDQMKREVAFLRAGVDLDSPVGKMFGKAYDGELDTEAIKTAASEVGAARTVSQEAPKVEEPQHDETQTQARMDLASNSGRPGTIEPGDPHQAALKAFDEARAEGSSRELASGAAFSKLIEAHHAGDKRVANP